MNKAELVAAIAAEAKLSKAQARDALQAFVTCVTQSLKTGDEVRIVGFGSLKAIERPAGPTRNPRTGKIVQRKASRTAKFRVGEGLKDALN